MEVLPNDETRLAEESSLLIMDIVVELEDGSVVNLEIQKIGYMFPGERSACYSADLLPRQYKRVQKRNEEKDKRSKNCYRDIKDVYTIVLFEHSPSAFKQNSDTYLHYFEQRSSSGVELNLLQKYLFVSLDIYYKIKHNENRMIQLDNKLEAWLAFLCMDDPEDIAAIIEQYPEFRVLYEQVYDTCRNVEDVMGLFSKELAELDHNTAELMVDEMQKELDEKKKVIARKDAELERKNVEIEVMGEKKARMSNALENNEIELSTMKKQMMELQKQMAVFTAIGK